MPCADTDAYLTYFVDQGRASAEEEWLQFMLTLGVSEGCTAH